MRYIKRVLKEKYHEVGLKEAKMRVILERFYRDDICTIGRIVINKQRIYTLELPWRDNKSNISCIPPGIYQVVKRFSKYSKYKYEHYHLKGTGKRTWILIHRGNYIDETTGCILVGTTIDEKMENVWKSKIALDYMLDNLPDKFELEITELK